MVWPDFLPGPGASWHALYNGIRSGISLKDLGLVVPLPALATLSAAVRAGATSCQGVYKSWRSFRPDKKLNPHLPSIFRISLQQARSLMTDVLETNRTRGGPTEPGTSPEGDVWFLSDLKFTGMRPVTNPRSEEKASTLSFKRLNAN